MDALNRIKFLEDRLHRLSEIGMALSTEKNTDRLFEMILEEAKAITHADGQTLYSLNKDGNLKFEIMATDSKNFYMGGTSGVDIPFPPLPLTKDGEPNQLVEKLTIDKTERRFSNTLKSRIGYPIETD